MEKRVWVSLLTLVVVVGFLVSFAFLFSRTGMTGFATYSESSQTDFDLGTYQNTSYNGSAVVLSGSNLTGTYTSKIFDASNDATWNSLTWQGNKPSTEFIFTVDNQADVWKSSDTGTTWSIVKDDYNSGDGNGVTASFFNSSKDYFIVYNQDLWVSQDSGLTFTKVNDDYNGAEGQNAFVATADKNNNIFIIEGDQDVWKSADSGVTFTKVSTDFNGGNGNIFGLVSDSSNNLYSVDNQADVWKSTDSGVTWTLIKDDYNGAAGNNADAMAIDSNNVLYILDLQDVWKSSDTGATWTKVNDDFNGAGDAEGGKSIITDSSNNVYVIDGGEDVFKSSDSGSTFTKVATNFNGANGITPTMAVVIQNSSLTFQVRNCSSADCSDGTWQTKTLSSMNLVSRYFQYKISFISPDTSISPTLASTIINYDLVNTAPTLNIIHPINESIYGIGETIWLNFTVGDTDGNLDSCWYHTNGGVNVTLPGCANTTINLGVGSHIILVYANDSLGAEGSASVSFSVTNSAPTITLVAPQDGASYGTNQSLSLNFIASDADNNVGSCWYKIDSGSSVAIAGCLNTTFNVAEGAHTLTVYANDTQGLEASDSASFSVSVGAPTILLSSPIDSYLNSQAVIFRYTPTDVNLASCELWGNFFGSFALNQTNANPTSGSENTFSLNLADGTYLWNIRCNDSVGNSAFNGNKTFYVDTTNPALSLSQPTGTKTSRTGIPLTFTITDASPTSCLYNIKWSTGESVIANTTITNCLSTSVSVAADGNYILNLYINDSAGNTNSTNSSFSVDTSTPSTPPVTPTTGGSGGGGGGSSFPPNKTEFSISLSDLGEVIMKPGESKSLSLEARNTGTKMQNNCKILVSDWIKGSEENDLNANELADFVFTVEVPQDVNVGDYDLSVVLKCQDGEKSSNLKVSILEGDIGVSIKEIREINKNKILFSYIIRELAGKNIDATLNFAVVDVDGNKIAESSASVSLSALEEKKLDAEIEVPAGTSGEYELVVEVSSEGVSVRDKTNVLITGTGITGFAGFLSMSETNKKYFSIAILVGVAGLFGFFIVRRIVKSMGKDSSRKGLIKIKKKGQID